MSTIGADDLRRLRLRAQRLVPDTGAGQGSDAVSGPERVAASARHMLAMQGQDWRSSRWALGVRTPDTTVADVHAAFDAGLLVRSWPTRGTVHVVAAEDIGWLQAATNAGPLAGAPKRRESLGITDATLDRLVETSLAALAANDSLDRDEISGFWDAAGLEWKPNWRYHLVWWLCQNGLATFGPTGDDGEPRLVLASAWIRSPRDLVGDEALAELARRYASPRGAVRTTDLAWWAGLSVTEARRGLTLAVEAGALIELALADARGAASRLWADPTVLDATDATDPGVGTGVTGIGTASVTAQDWLLLPAFDEHLLGYRDRDPQFDAAHLSLLIPGRNGIFQATVSAGGRTVATWKRGTRKDEGVLVRPFPGEQVDVASLRPQVDRWTAFHGGPELPIAIQNLA